MKESIEAAQQLIIRLFEPEEFSKNEDAKLLWRHLDSLSQEINAKKDLPYYGSEKFYCMMLGRPDAPKYVHEGIESAVTEAKRLHELVTNGTVQILQIVGEVRSVEVPVTRKEMRVFIKPKFSTQDDDLPF